MKKAIVITKLIDIRGIGETVASKLTSFYGTENLAITTIADGNIFSLIDAGLSEKIALKVVRSYKNAINGEEYDDALQTQDILTIYNKIIKIIQNYSLTTYGKSKILVELFPNKRIIAQNQNVFKNAQVLASMNFGEYQEIIKTLSDFRPLELVVDLDIKERTIVTTVPEVLKALKALKITKYCPVELITSFTELKNFEQSDELILLLTEHEFDEINNPGIILLNENALENPWINILPEKIMFFFIQNLKTLKKAIDFTKIFKIPQELQNTFPTFLDSSLKKNLNILETILSKINVDGSLKEEIDPELTRIGIILKSFETESYNLQAEVNELINDKIENTKIQLEGKKVLEILKTSDVNFSGNNLREYIDDSVFSIISSEVSLINDKLNAILKLQPDETEILENLYPSEIQLPIEMNEDVFQAFLGYMRKKYDKQEFLQLSTMASSLENFRPTLESLVREIFELDYLFAIGKFAYDFNLKLPSFVKTGTGISFKNAVNMFLGKSDKTNPKVKNVLPVTYNLGDIPDVDPSRIIILSGANSGGKTSILQLISQILILAHMGLGVPAEETFLSSFDYFYFYQKPTGSADAGAFETALKNFAEMILDKEDTSKFILADEMEAISEPEASARVISAFLDILEEQKSTCGLFVSHLAEQINNHSNKKIRIDGIEATGLDENLELIVDRNPKINYHARSTPQLIVESLIKKSKNKEHEFYKKILDKFSK